MKKNRPILVLRITEPCNERWDAMPSTQTGKFCEKCSRNLVDFSGFSDRRLTEYFARNSGNMCGRFTADQLNRNLYPETGGTSSAQRLSLPALALLAMTLTTQIAYGQGPDKSQTELLPGTAEEDLPDGLKLRTIDGGVSILHSAASDPMIAVKVELIQGDSVLRTRFTDTKGIFSISVLPHEQPDHIRFSKADGDASRESLHAITESLYDGFTTFSLEQDILPPPPSIHFLGGFGAYRN